MHTALWVTQSLVAMSVPEHTGQNKANGTIIGQIIPLPAQCIRGNTMRGWRRAVTFENPARAERQQPY